MSDTGLKIITSLDYLIRIGCVCMYAWCHLNQDFLISRENYAQGGKWPILKMQNNHWDYVLHIELYTMKMGHVFS